MLKSVSDIKGDPSAAGSTWKWTAAGFGMEFEGIGRCVKHQPGRLYVSKTEGGIEGTITYRAEADGEGTKLSIESECRIPGQVLSRRYRLSDVERGLCYKSVNGWGFL